MHSLQVSPRSTHAFHHPFIENHPGACVTNVACSAYSARDEVVPTSLHDYKTAAQFRFLRMAGNLISVTRNSWFAV